MAREERVGDLSWCIRQATRLAFRYGQIGWTDVDDLVQNCLLRVLGRRSELPPTMGWLAKTMRSVALDAQKHFRRQHRFLTVSDDWDADAIISECVDRDGRVRSCATFRPSQDQVEPDMMPHLQSALSKLTPILRQTLVLHAEGFSYDEIAKLTETKIGTVRSRLFNARLKAQALVDIA